jgi:hypothetical protein
MGYYINNTNVGEGKSNPFDWQLPATGKADAILEAGIGAKEIKRPSEWQPDLVCVVENGVFDAAAYAFDEEEFLVFADPHDTRRKRWLIVPNAAKLSGYER